jgi:hypothetical protein
MLVTLDFTQGLRRMVWRIQDWLSDGGALDMSCDNFWDIGSALAVLLDGFAIAGEPPEETPSA